MLRRSGASTADPAYESSAGPRRLSVHICGRRAVTSPQNTQVSRCFCSCPPYMSRSCQCYNREFDVPYSTRTHSTAEDNQVCVSGSDLSASWPKRFRQPRFCYPLCVCWVSTRISSNEKTRYTLEKTSTAPKLRHFCDAKYCRFVTIEVPLASPSHADEGAGQKGRCRCSAKIVFVRVLTLSIASEKGNGRVVRWASRVGKPTTRLLRKLTEYCRDFGWFSRLLVLLLLLLLLLLRR